MSGREVIHDRTCGVPTGRTWACACNERNGYRDSTPPLEPVAAQTLAVIQNLAMEHMDCSGCPTPWWLKQALGADLQVPPTPTTRSSDE